MVSKRYSTRQFLASIVLTAGISVFFVNAYMQHTNEPCKNLLADGHPDTVFSTQPSIQANASSSCLKDNKHLSWVTWLTRAPESMQFHYMDLLELLNERN